MTDIEDMKATLDLFLKKNGCHLALVALTPKTSTPVPVQEAIKDGWNIIITLEKDAPDTDRLSVTDK